MGHDNSLTRRNLLLQFGAFGVAQTISNLYPPSVSAEQRLPPDRKVALLIGNWNYGKVSKLNSPSADIKKIAETLRAKNFESLQILPNCNIKQANLAIAKFSEQARTARIAFFYYSGHGMQLDGKNYGVPVDFDASEPRVLLDDNEGWNLFALDWAETAIGRSSGLGIMVVDACRENPYISQLNKNNPFRTFRQGLAPNTTRNEYALVSYAAGPNQLAKDGAPRQNSLYTEKLVEYLNQDNLSVKQMFEKTQSAVCDATAPGALPSEPGKGSCQRPEVTHNIGSDLVYLTPQSYEKNSSESDVIVSFGLANLDDAIVRSFTKPDVATFRYKYLMLKPDSRHDKTRIIPDLDFFKTMDSRGTPLIVVDQNGYYAPEEESGGWGLSYPVLDLVVRSITPKPVKLKSLRIETRKSREDKNPYFDIMAPANQFTLTIINQSWENITNFELNFDVIGRLYLQDDQARDYADSRMPLSLPLKAFIANIKESSEISLAEVIKTKFPQVEHFTTLQNHNVEITRRGKLRMQPIDDDGSPTGPYLKMPPPGFEDWYRANKAEIDSFDLRPLWIFGRATATSSTGATISAEFIAPLSLYNYGVGGGAIEFDANEIIKLPINGLDFTVEIPINRTLSISKQTFRGLYPLIVDKSSFHEISVEVLDVNGTPIYSSGWIDLHALVSRNDKLAVLAERKSLRSKL